MNRPMLEKVATLEEGMKKCFLPAVRPYPSFLLKEEGGEEFSDILTVGDKSYPILAERYAVKIRKISEYGRDASKNSALNVYSFVGCDIPLKEHIYRELSIAEYILNTKLVKITAYINKNAANIIAVAENKTTANLDLGNSLCAGSENQCRYKLITSHGMANDIAVGTLTATNQLNVFKTDKKLPDAYDDDEYYLYGLSETDVCRAYIIYDILRRNLDADAFCDTYERLNAAVDAVYLSDKESRSVYISEVLS